MRLPHSLLFLQGLYYLATGLWPMLHMRSFEAVTGPKTDKWLVKAFGLLVCACALPLLLESGRETASPAAVALAVGSAAALAAVDVVYSVKRVISWVYLADAALEISILFLWGFWALRATAPAL